jgi:hypothetical protein
MRKWAICVFAVVFTGAVGTTIAQKRSATSALVGVWRVSEVTFTGPNARTVTNPQPGLIVVTPTYYSAVLITADSPRPDLPQGASDKERLDAFGPFAADAGTYDIKGDELTSHVIVAKNPNRMRPGSFETDTLKMEGKNTLWLTPKMRDTGPVNNPTTTKLIRIE